jgi:hypothetical protein
MCESAQGSVIFRAIKGSFGMSLQEEVRPGDTIAILLDCSTPKILRKRPDGKYLFIGCVHIHGLMDGEALLGPLPDGYEVVIDQVSTNSADEQQLFVDRVTRRRSPIDPRLGPLAPDWQPVVAADRLWPHKKVNAFKNTKTAAILHTELETQDGYK